MTHGFKFFPKRETLGVVDQQVLRGEVLLRLLDVAGKLKKKNHIIIFSVSYKGRGQKRESQQKLSSGKFEQAVLLQKASKLVKEAARETGLKVLMFIAAKHRVRAGKEFW